MDIDTFKELVGLLVPNQSPQVLRQALDALPGVITSCTDEQLTKIPNLSQALIKLLPLKEIGPMALRSIAALSVFEQQAASLTAAGVVAPVRDAILASPPLRELLSAILSNVTRTCDDACTAFFSLPKFSDSTKARCLYLAKFLTLADGTGTVAANIGNVLVHLTRVEIARKLLCSDTCMPKVQTLLENADTADVGLMIVKNTAFSGSDEPVARAIAPLVPILLQRLVVEGSYDDEDLASLHIDIRLTLEAIRTGSAQPTPTPTRLTAVEALIGLCGCRVGRDALRDGGVYPIIRELHKTPEATDGEGDLGAAIEELVNGFMPEEPAKPDDVKPDDVKPVVEEIDEDDL